MSNGEIAQIFLKNGRRETGLLLNDVNRENAFDEGVKYVPNRSIGAWLDSFSQDLVQVIHPDQVEGIDLFLR
ncbi:MAG TPA: hypothetical protein VFU15_16185 [Bacteroidia bacterium]|nr:hypothetical protein [Bacteroidia bacterium]